MLLERYWINAPSTHDSVHLFNGRNVLANKNETAYPNTSNSSKVYFTRGLTISADIPKKFLAKGWHDERQTQNR